jgi:hypothetical protein
MKNRLSSIISLTKEGQWWNCWIKFLASFFSLSVSLSQLTSLVFSELKSPILYCVNILVKLTIHFLNKRILK